MKTRAPTLRSIPISTRRSLSLRVKFRVLHLLCLIATQMRAGLAVPVREPSCPASLGRIILRPSAGDEDSRNTRDEYLDVGATPLGIKTRAILRPFLQPAFGT